MNVSKLVSVLFIPLCVGTAAVAQGAAATEPTDASASTVSRAEVLADMQIWRESGLAAEQQAGDRDADLSSNSYRAAEARYAAMRASPAFTALVARIARERAEKVQIAGK